MSQETMLIGLVAITFVAAIGWGLWQRARTKASQERSGDPDGRKGTRDAAQNHDSKR